MLTQSTLKLIAFELVKTDIEFYFEAALLLEAYQALVQHQVPFSRLDEFWDASSQKLARFSRRFAQFLAAQELNFPEYFQSQMRGVPLKKTPLGLFLFNFLQLKLTADLEAISCVFTSMFMPEDILKRHALDAKIRKKLHAYADLKMYCRQLEGFEAWIRFAEFTLPEKATLSAWLQIVKDFLLMLNVKIPEPIVILLEAFFLPADRYLAAMPYPEFLQHVNLFLEDTWVDAEVVVEKEVVQRGNPFVPGRLVQEYGIIFNSPSPAAATERRPLPRGRGEKVYQLDMPTDILQNPEQLKLREQTGGAAILNQQAACPFKAFGHFQLKLEPLVMDEAWLSGKLKGIAIHRILEKIWQQLTSQANLLNLSETQLNTLVFETTTQVIFALSHTPQFFLPQSLAQLEIKRLTQLIVAWLVAEKQRPEFKIHALEVESLAYLGNLVIKLRLDRVDELADGWRLVLDYKTGSVSIKEWLQEPMGDMQLPLYVLTTQASGALLAEVKRDLQFSGIVDEGVECFSEVKTAEQAAQRTWQEVKNFWQKNIDQLADDISRGYAEVKPESGACDYCDLQAVCRIKEIINAPHPSPLPQGERGSLV